MSEHDINLLKLPLVSRCYSWVNVSYINQSQHPTLVNNLAHFVQQKRNFFQRHLTPLKFLYVKIYVPRTPQKKFEANRSGSSLHRESLLFSRFYLLKRWFLTISEVKLWSSGGSNFGCVTIQTSNPTYILKFRGFDPKNPSGFLLDPSWTDVFLR